MKKKQNNKVDDSPPSKVFDWLYIGSYANASDRNLLDSLNIKYILNCTFECKNKFENDGIEYMRFKIHDVISYPIQDFFDQGSEFITKVLNGNDGNLLVHCLKGKSRSAAMIIAFLIKSEGFTTNNAYTFLKKKHPKTLPNLGFMEKLRAYEKKIAAEKEKKNETEKENE